MAYSGGFGAGSATNHELPLGHTLRTNAQSAQRYDQAKFQIKAVATKRIIFFGTKSEKGRPRFHSAGPRDVAGWSMVDGAVADDRTRVSQCFARSG
jgi:hypothetical protein